MKTDGYSQNGIVTLKGDQPLNVGEIYSNKSRLDGHLEKGLDVKWTGHLLCVHPILKIVSLRTQEKTIKFAVGTSRQANGGR